jgi:two-component system, NtrC family, sensor kinase
MKRKVTLPLFWKFTIAIVMIVTIFGGINLYFLSTYIGDLFEKEVSNNGLIMAKTVAERSVEPILYNDLAALNKLVTELKMNDKNIAYTFILDDHNNVLAHTFEKKVPQMLVDLISPNNVQTIKLTETDLNTATIRDISVPILDSNLGTVRLGFYEDNYLNTINIAERFFITLVLLFLFVGILGALVFSFIITKPITILSKMAKQVNLDDFKVADLDRERPNFILDWNKKLKIHDEIDDLFRTFNKMVFRLNKTYNELQSAQKSLMQSEKIASIGTLSAGLAHEINNPIAGIQNCLRRISKNPKNIEQNKVYIDLMEEAIEKIKSVVGGLLNFSRKHELVFSKVDMSMVVENVLVLVSFQLEKSRIGFVKNFQKNAPLISGSNNHLEQVVLNLLINAIDAINEKQVKDYNLKGVIKINLFSNSNALILEIIDNGIGIPVEKIDSIFDPFFTMKKIKQGTGLGLSVSYNIIAQHKGLIKAEENINGGMKFSITLPLN